MREEHTHPNVKEQKTPAYTIEYSCGHKEPGAPFLLTHNIYIDYKCAHCHVEAFSTPNGRPICY